MAKEFRIRYDNSNGPDEDFYCLETREAGAEWQQACKWYFARSKADTMEDDAEYIHFSIIVNINRYLNDGYRMIGG